MRYFTFSHYHILHFHLIFLCEVLDHLCEFSHLILQKIKIAKCKNVTFSAFHLDLIIFLQNGPSHMFNCNLKNKMFIIFYMNIYIYIYINELMLEKN